MVYRQLGGVGCIRICHYIWGMGERGIDVGGAGRSDAVAARGFAISLKSRKFGYNKNDVI